MQPATGWRRAAFVALVGTLASACGTSTPTASPAQPTATASISSPTPTAPGAASPSTVNGVAYDEALLGILPETVAGMSITSTPEVAGEIGQDPSLREIADRFAAGVVADQATGELAVATLIHLRPAVFGDVFYRDYRDTFDEAACEPAGGLVGNAEAEIGGRLTFIATCENGARTYHTHVESADVIVSVIATGDQLRLGEQLIDGLRG